MPTSLTDANPMLAALLQATPADAAAQPPVATAPAPGQPAVPTPPADVIQPAPQVPPAQPVTGGGAIGVDVPGMGPIIPMTRDQVRALDRRTNELSDQLMSARGRREDLVEELANATSPVVISGLEARIGVLDARLVSLEQSIAENGELKSSIAANLGALSTEPSRSSENSNTGPFSGWFGWAMFGMMALLLFRSMRRVDRRPVAPVSAESEARFAQLEQAIDTVAVEIERVSEGQRFVTKLLREGQSVPDFTSGRVPETVDVRRAEGSS